MGTWGVHLPPPSRHQSLLAGTSITTLSPRFFCFGPSGLVSLRDGAYRSSNPRRPISDTHHQVFPGPSDNAPDSPKKGQLKSEDVSEECCGPLTPKEMHNVWPHTRHALRSPSSRTTLPSPLHILQQPPSLAQFSHISKRLPTVRRYLRSLSPTCRRGRSTPRTEM